MLHRRTTSKQPGSAVTDAFDETKKATTPLAAQGSHSYQTDAYPNSNATGAASSTIASTSASASTPKRAPPLRRPSSGLYSSPSSAPRARYTVPSPSPSYMGLSVTPPIYPSSPAYGENSGAGFLSPNGYGGGNGYGGAAGYSSGKDVEEDEALRRAAMDLTVWLRRIKSSLERCRQGLSDAVRLDRSVGLVLGTLVLKSTLINLLSLLLLSLFPLVLSPLLVSSPSAKTRTNEIGLWYNLLLSYPVFVSCFWINATWSPAISKRAQSLLHPTYRHQPSPASTPYSSSATSSFSSSSNPFSWATAAITRLLLIGDFQVVSRLIHLTPVFGPVLSMLYMSVIDAYYFFESTFSARGWGLEHKVDYMQDRVAYMIGFGFPATFITSFGPTLVNMAIFALLYPLFVIQALQSRPPNPKSSLLPSTPSPHTSAPPSPMTSTIDLTSDPFFNSSTPSRSVSRWKVVQRPKLPIFFFARYALDGLRWLEAALLRDRKGSSVRGWEERAGRRLN